MTVHNPTASREARRYLSIDEVCEMVPGVTRANLAQMRFRGIGPRYLRPSPRVIIYDRADIEAWLAASARTSTAAAS
ncbi:AlpA family transcriptional regulator [Rathayibacter sp. AY1D9]|uniref:helix-turn-helix transcriptional regulator n=1 Tax=Rathayibacter sp. AY1D9 TaxID=2080548 RepID=UPI000CE7E7A2|nr:hypothetical protein [Rathayibacter sp. AY1D9]PPH84893.1 hypothetical protein C5C50_00965 [Rathayibacter sp. AY1D9]